ncbi:MULTISPECIES: sigma-54-dependent Fis family transcriptional regulator [unclassified Microbacterium]|uniref:sigma-54-dependent Fis family transcriptional regulator n=1 Tax=unclassified Microbacterium TaxID=2609290 RepID=UPI00301672CB
MEQTHNRRLEIAAARAVFLEQGTPADEVRPVVAASWQRSRSLGVDALTSAPGYHTDLDTDGRLVSAARPVLDRLADEVAELALSIALTDASSRLLLRVDTEQRIGRLLDSVHFAPGFDYGESAVGTNGVGTAFESRQPVTISGPEHFAERLQAFSCTGAPIRDPLSGRVAGVLDITCLFEDSSPVLRSLVRATTSEIERLLLVDRGFEQQAVFDAYTRIATRSKGAVGAVGLTVLLADHTMHDQFSPAEYEELRTHARYLADRSERAEDDIQLSSGTRVHLRAQRVTARERAVGVVFDVFRLSDASAADAAALTAPTTASPGWRRAEADVTTAIRSSSPVVVAGEAATGKATLVADAFRGAHPTGTVEVVDSPARAEALADELPHRESATLVLIRRLDGWDAASAASIARLAEAAGPPHMLAATFTGSDGDGRHAALLQVFVASVVVPPLRHRTHDLPQLVDAALSGMSRPRGLSPRALRALANHDWPGNLVELHEVLRCAASRRPAGAIELHDLPESLSARAPRRLSTMESSERDLIVAALRDTEGNRLRAASQLGISRATLYRKIGQYGIAL